MNSVKTQKPRNEATSRQNQLWIAVGRAWSTASKSLQSQWMIIGQQMSQHSTQALINGSANGKNSVKANPTLTLTSTTATKPMSGYKACLVVSSIKASLNGGVVDITPPAAVNLPNALPSSMQLSVTQSAAEDADAQTASAGVQIVLNSPGFYSPAQIFASESVLTPTPILPDMPMTLIDTVTHLDSTQDITQKYLARYAPPVVGTKVALLLFPVSADGFRGKPLFLQADVVAAPAALSVAA